MHYNFNVATNQTGLFDYASVKLYLTDPILHFKWLGFRRASQAGSIDDFTSTACGQKYRNDLRRRTVYGKNFRLIQYQTWPFYIKAKKKKREKKYTLLKE